LIKLYGRGHLYKLVTALR